MKGIEITFTDGTPDEDVVNLATTIAALLDEHYEYYECVVSVVECREER